MSVQGMTMAQQMDTYLQSGTNELKILEYEAGGGTYGINILKVSRIVAEPESLCAVPNMNPCIRGVFNNHGKVISLLDLGMFLTGTPTPMDRQSRVIVTEFFGQLNGLLVDRVQAVHTVLWEQVIDAAEVMEKYENPYVISIVHPSEERMILLLDYESIILELSPHRAEMETQVAQDTSLEGGGKRVLLVEDSPAVRDILRTMLEQKNFQVETAKDGREGWETIQKGSFDLLVSDVEMPRMDGLALTSKVRENPATADLPVIIYSSIGDTGMKARAEFLKASHVTKLNPVELFEKIESALQ